MPSRFGNVCELKRRGLYAAQKHLQREGIKFDEPGNFDLQVNSFCAIFSFQYEDTTNGRIWIGTERFFSIAFENATFETVKMALGQFAKIYVFIQAIDCLRL